MGLRLPRIPSGYAITTPLGIVTNTFQLWWQSVAEQVEGSFDALAVALTALAAASAAQDTADGANTNADGREPAITPGTTSQYWRGDKSWQPLNKAAVGLGNVDNTADSTKNVLSATKLTTARQIGGVAFDGTADVAPLLSGMVSGTLTNAVDDAAAAGAGVAVGHFYRNGSIVMVRVT